MRAPQQYLGFYQAAKHLNENPGKKKSECQNRNIYTLKEGAKDAASIKDK